jgi:hypothetical protein
MIAMNDAQIHREATILQLQEQFDELLDLLRILGYAWDQDNRPWSVQRHPYRYAFDEQWGLA